MRPATCHPDRPASTWGLCAACYHRAYRAGNGAKRRYNLTPLTGLARLPPRLADVPSHTFTTWPDKCLHCCSTGALVVEPPREAHCAGDLAGCGWTGYLVSTAIVRFKYPDSLSGPMLVSA